jgi:hypothetical protein
MDMSWMKEEIPLTELSEPLDKVAMNELKVKYIYVNMEKEVIKTKEEVLNVPLPPKNIIKKEILLQKIQTNKEETESAHYVLSELLLFHLEMKSDDIPWFFEQKTYDNFMKRYPVVDDIEVLESMVVFHPYNTLYVVYLEKEKLKSIMKKKDSKHRITKRVRIKIPKETRITRKSI